MVKVFSLVIIMIVISCCGTKKKTAESITATKIEPSSPVAAAASEEDGKGIVTTVRIIRTSCASLVAIITDDNMVDKGEQWAPYNVRMAKPYKGAFAFINQSQFPTIKEGFEFKAKLLTALEAPKLTEERCALEDFPPATKYFVKALTTPKEQQ